MKPNLTKTILNYGTQQNPKTVCISGREREIVVLLSDGFISKQIAEKLNISKHTVDTHRRNLIRKTDSKNSVEVVTACKEQGLF